MRVPPFLRPGDTVGLVALASRLDYDTLEPAFRILRDEWKLNVLEGQSLTSSHFQFAGDDALRLHDFQHMLDNPDVRAVFSVRGGYGSYRLLDGLDFTGFQNHPKWVVGFSDITAVHYHLQTLGVESLHAVMPKLFGQEGGGPAVETLRQWLFGEKVAPYATAPHPLNRPGKATGPLLGGNLTMLTNMLATPSDVDYRGRILFIEDIDETYFSLDRMLLQLRRAGRLEKLAGLLVGQFSDMRINETAPFGKTTDEIIAEHVAGYDYPVCFNFPVGHVALNLALPVGHEATLEVLDSGARLIFS
ncbi:S66 peptidase family protein [Tellurirhabdus rosea]|uniref:S66 peptidase family protein n=1 Tax=Tellurirhabdus rosea TaxID=2674997 RepID=UPI002254E88F|nr:LD-carboxypeptidase [Tellurirhabdus rosea]